MKKANMSILSLFALSACFVVPHTTATTTADTISVADSSSSVSVQSGMEGKAVTVVYAGVPDDAVPDSPGGTDILVGGSSPENLFSGDLSQFSGLRFRVTGDGTLPSSVAVYMYRYFENRIHIWRHDEVAFSETAGDWTVVRIPFDSSKGWAGTIGGRYRSPEDAWVGDIANVDALIVRISRNGNKAQSYSLADFQLIGDGPDAITEPARLSMIEDYFGVSSIEEIDRSLDSNGNGMSDYDTLRAGLDPRDPSAIFATAVQRAPSGNVVQWPGVLGGRYAVMRSNDLRQGFQVVAGGVTAGFTGTQSYIDQNPLEGMPNFYKVLKY